ncbi:MAG TPA: competence/damage-inducible protein A [Hungateiclostridium thermocellum]|uniref:Putative competence-damage inducible protein n=1 Tax=Acetivibrio thermocellus (strain ATCC 27405 / DSM 1237 / JCM 9322 / NBRC 103400 / NCIMB 10682 / NRRL B-4536 / VPI 7372) TaxID=203119 RepID=CINA_ACET2|nr:competence/damage-inducible protein A [Acetivibrio thermocellus]A3DEA5.1 RecName: Full=Putative competence-damage inducible protein [Acetivibrio thermocellus ATCC 27405]CDG35747.1 putative competence-damage inducible protein [Acetivibrio thermocellus BC1]ABN52284.1 competence/damage-inducible protein CinA [Acetivibrio thermocellus ATCC 27405]THJ76931.1 competence/damage-inducible protein A [Acetivibrio thermocellus]UWV48114.1 competence/damage-inducible protein A [Acetivibrio thermocellus]
MNAEILAVGTELLMGQIANTNAQYISKRLNDIGVNVYYHSVVGDNSVRLKKCLLAALERCDLVIMTGGLGPTQDDLTKETVAEVLGKKLVLHEESLERIKTFFTRINRKMTDNNVKQAYLPEGCTVVENNSGTAPGCIIEDKGKIVVMLPGPPPEMMPMLDDTVIPYLAEKSGYRIVSKYLRVFGIGESQLEEMIMDLVDKQDRVTIATYAKDGQVTVRLTTKARTEEEGFREILPLQNEIASRLKEALYSTEDEELEYVAAKMLIDNNITIATAESCTGGLISARLTDVPGISKVFNRGIVSYSNEAKMENLGVKPETLEKYGAVSSRTAMEMAEGVRKIASTDIGLAVTGIAGPDGGTDEKPVGLVYVALAHSLGTEVRELRLAGNRNRIRNLTVLNAFDMVRRYVMKLKG